MRATPPIVGCGTRSVASFLKFKRTEELVGRGAGRRAPLPRGAGERASAVATFAGSPLRPPLAAYQPGLNSGIGPKIGGVSGFSAGHPGAAYPSTDMAPARRSDVGAVV